MHPVRLAAALPAALSVALCSSLVFADSSPATARVEQPRTLFSLSDEFSREDAASLGEAWLDCNAQLPDNFEPLGILDDGVIVYDPNTRPGVYDEKPPSGHPPTDNRLYHGIGCASVDTGSTTVSVKLTWSGHFGIEQPPPISHVEASPLLYVNPEHPRFGFGAWTTQLFGRAIIMAGYVGSPPENFEVVATGMVPDGHESGTPREVELRAEQPGKVTIWIDGQQIPMSNGYGLDPIEVDPGLVGSTRHGIALDAHLVDPVTAVRKIKGIEAVTITALPDS